MSDETWRENYAGDFPDPRDEILWARDVDALVSKVTAAFHKARVDWTEDSDVVRKLDEAGGLLDEVSDILRDTERERDR